MGKEWVRNPNRLPEPTGCWQRRTPQMRPCGRAWRARWDCDQAAELREVRSQVRTAERGKPTIAHRIAHPVVRENRLLRSGLRSPCCAEPAWRTQWRTPRLASFANWGKVRSRARAQGAENLLKPTRRFTRARARLTRQTSSKSRPAALPAAGGDTGPCGARKTW